MKKPGVAAPLGRSARTARVAFFLVVLIAGLLLASRRTVNCERSSTGDVTCSIAYRSFDRAWRSRTVSYVRDVRLAERKSNRGKGATTSKQVLEIVGDEAISDDHREDLGPLRAFLRQSARSELRIETPRDPRRVVGSWLLLGLAVLLVLGWLVELTVGRERIYALFGMSPEDDDAPLPGVPAWRPLVALVAIAPVVLFFIYGHHYVGDRATRKVKALHAAVQDEDIEALRSLLAGGVDPDATDDQYVPPLLTAARVGPAEAVEQLLAAGADPNVSDLSGRTPLIAASSAGDPSRVALLIQAEAGLDAADESLWTPLASSAYAGDAESLRLLLEAGADPHQPFQNGAGLLHVAAGSGSVEAMRLLLEAGLDPDAVRDDGVSVWDAAGSTTNAGEIRALLETFMPARSLGT